MGLAGEPQPATGECQKLFFMLRVCFVCFVILLVFDNHVTSQTVIICLQQTGI